MNVALFGQTSRVWTLAKYLSCTRFGAVFGGPSHVAGHEIAEQFVLKFQRAVQGGSYSHAARVCDVVLFSDPLADFLSEEEGMSEALRGKVVIDLTDLFGLTQSGREPSGAQNLRTRLPDTEIVFIRRAKAERAPSPTRQHQALVPDLSNPKTAQIVGSVLAAAGIDLVEPQAPPKAFQTLQA